MTGSPRPGSRRCRSPAFPGANGKERSSAGGDGGRTEESGAKPRSRRRRRSSPGPFRPRRLEADDGRARAGPGGLGGRRRRRRQGRRRLLGLARRRRREQAQGGGSRGVHCRLAFLRFFSLRRRRLLLAGPPRRPPAAFSGRRLYVRLRASHARAPPGRTHWSEPVALDASAGGAAAVAVPAAAGLTENALLFSSSSSHTPPQRAAYVVALSASQGPGGCLLLRAVPRYILRSGVARSGASPRCSLRRRSTRARRRRRPCSASTTPRALSLRALALLRGPRCPHRRSCAPPPTPAPAPPGPSARGAPGSFTGPTRRARCWSRCGLRARGGPGRAACRSSGPGTRS